ncbi:MAG TPA: hypothetical protein VIY47_12150, partial [Ignavibacteriaceae bacterium]
MHRKTDIQELDIPNDDIECWDRYPKHRWVYELSRLLDAQNIKWSPFEVESLSERELNIVMKSEKSLMSQPGFIYVNKPAGPHIFSEIFLTKGEIKLIRHIDSSSNIELDSLVGEVELRLNAFITLYFQKFTGVITTETYSNEIFRIYLRPYLDITQEKNQEVIKL